MLHNRPKKTEELQREIEDTGQTLYDLKNTIEKQGITEERYKQREMLESRTRQLYMQLADTYKILGNKRDALIYYKCSLTYGYESRYIHLQCALIYKSFHENNKAVEHFQKIIQLDRELHDYPQAFYYIAKIVFDRIRLDKKPKYSSLVIPYLINSLFDYKSDKGYTLEEISVILNQILREAIFKTITRPDKVPHRDTRIRLLTLCLDDKSILGQRFAKFEGPFKDYRNQIAIELQKHKSEKEGNTAQATTTPDEKSSAATHTQAKLKGTVLSYFFPLAKPAKDGGELRQDDIELQSAIPSSITTTPSTTVVPAKQLTPI